MARNAPLKVGERRPPLLLFDRRLVHEVHDDVLELGLREFLAAQEELAHVEARAELRRDVLARELLGPVPELRRLLLIKARHKSNAREQFTVWVALAEADAHSLSACSMPLMSELSLLLKQLGSHRQEV